MELDSDSSTLTIVAAPPPLFTDADGVIRVSDTRITLDTVVTAFEEGATAEEIVYQYPTLHLADVYAVLGYYLQHQAKVETYLRRRQQHAQVVRESNEARYTPQGIRERLMARRSPHDIASGR